MIVPRLAAASVLSNMAQARAVASSSAQALVFSRYGNPLEVLELKSVPLPPVGQDDVLVEMLAVRLLLFLVSPILAIPVNYVYTCFNGIALVTASACWFFYPPSVLVSCECIAHACVDRSVLTTLANPCSGPHEPFRHQLRRGKIPA